MMFEFADHFLLLAAVTIDGCADFWWGGCCPLSKR